MPRAEGKERKELAVTANVYEVFQGDIEIFLKLNNINRISTILIVTSSFNVYPSPTIYYY